MKQALLFSGLLVLGACSSSPTTVVQTESPVAAVTAPLFSTLYSNISQPMRLVIRDEDTWSALWAQMVAAGLAPGTAPAVDFTRENVVVAAMGERKAAGYEISITGVTKDAGGLRVDVASKAPSPTCDRSEVITTPLHAVRIPKSSDPVRFIETTVVLSCS